MKDILGFEDEHIDKLDGTEDWERMADSAVDWISYGVRIRSIASLEDEDAIAKYKGSDSEKIMSWIAEHLDLNSPNQFMVSELADIVDGWVMRTTKADEAVAAILTSLDGYIGGC